MSGMKLLKQTIKGISFINAFFNQIAPHKMQDSSFLPNKTPFDNLPQVT